MNRPLLLHWSFISGLIGGILIVLGTVLMLFMMGMMGGMMGWMMPYAPLTDMGGWFVGMGLWMLVWSSAVGAVVIVGAVQVRTAKSPLGWGIALVIAGVLSFPTMGGFLIGGLATIASGVLALVAAGPTPTSHAGASPPKA